MKALCLEKDIDGDLMGCGKKNTCCGMSRTLGKDGLDNYLKWLDDEALLLTSYI
jgi:hypothetical protein